MPDIFDTHKSNGHDNSPLFLDTLYPQRVNIVLTKQFSPKLT